MKKKMMMSFITLGTVFAALLGGKAILASRKSECERELNDLEDQMDARHRYLDELESGYWDVDPRDYL